MNLDTLESYYLKVKEKFPSLTNDQILEMIKIKVLFDIKRLLGK